MWQSTLQRYASVVWLLVAALAIQSSPTHGWQEQLTERSVVVAVHSADEMYVGEDRLAPSQVVDEVTRRLNALPPSDQVVFVKVGPDVAYGPVVRLLDALRERGINRIGLITEKPDTSVAGSEDAPSNSPPATDAEAAPTSEEGNAEVGAVVELGVDRRGRATYAIDGGRVAARRLVATLRDRLARVPRKHVLIVAPSGVAYSRVVWVIDCAKSAGATDIALQQQHAHKATPN